MKNILTLIIALATVQIFAQTHEIIKHNGEKLDINFIKIENNLIYYSLPSSTEEKKISKYAVAQLNDKSKNNSQTISEKIYLTKKSDYKKVIILKESETVGLKKSNDLSSFWGKIKGQSRIALLEMGEKRLKENAALKGEPFIVILSNKADDLRAITFTY
ncbi:hypothetical protein [Flavobacterium aestivum]|uniref:hypothetical protein n=1 Tax=Flavobacterium aestivum TaxID=3003257 RepID=UPI002482650E|nr:hypothetical protein [Flavobacterium aestivum]